MRTIQLVLCATLALLLLPIAAAIPEPVRGTFHNSTYHCYQVTMREAERREAQVVAASGGTIPYPLPSGEPVSGLDARPTVEAAVRDTFPTLEASDDVLLETTCFMTSLPRPVTPPDVVGLVWDAVWPIIGPLVEPRG